MLICKIPWYYRIAFKADTEGSSDSAKDDLVKSASLIAQESSNFAEMARKMASSCNEQGLKQVDLDLGMVAMAQLV